MLTGADGDAKRAELLALYPLPGLASAEPRREVYNAVDGHWVCEVNGMNGWTCARFPALREGGAA